jgi:hypothetical protein
VKDELRAITCRPGSFDRSVMMSSLMPSEKYSCSGSPLMLLKASTAMDGLSVDGRRRSPLRRDSGHPRRRQLSVRNDDAEYLDRARDVLHCLLAAPLDLDRHLAAHLVGGRARDVDAAGLGQGLDAGGDIDAVAVYVVAIDDDVADIDADAEFDPMVGRCAGVALADLALDLYGAGHGIDGAGELDEGAVAHQFDHSPGMPGDRRIDDVAAQRLQPAERAGLIEAHQARIADHIGRQNGREPALDAPFPISCSSLQKNFGNARGVFNRLEAPALPTDWKTRALKKERCRVPGPARRKECPRGCPDGVLALRFGLQRFGRSLDRLGRRGGQNILLVVGFPGVVRIRLGLLLGAPRQGRDGTRTLRRGACHQDGRYERNRRQPDQGNARQSSQD